MITYIVFRHSDRFLVAAGEDAERMPIYIRGPSKQGWRRFGQLNWPSCMKFWDSNDVHVIQQGEAEDHKELVNMLNSGKAVKWS